MNTHLKQLWAAMKLPKNFKKSYKFFCLGLDIRVAQVVEPHLGQSCPFQHPMEHMQHTVRGNRPAIGGRKHPGAIAHFLSLFFQNAYRMDRMPCTRHISIL